VNRCHRCDSSCLYRNQYQLVSCHTLCTLALGRSWAGHLTIRAQTPGDPGRALSAASVAVARADGTQSRLGNGCARSLLQHCSSAAELYTRQGHGHGSMRRPQIQTILLDSSTVTTTHDSHSPRCLHHPLIVHHYELGAVHSRSHPPRCFPPAPVAEPPPAP